MSIIERAMDRLGSAPQAQGKPSAGEGAHALTPDRIERVASLAPESKAGLVRAASMTTQTLRVDLDRLRQRGMITPDGERTLIAESFRRIKRQILTNVANPRVGTPNNLVLVTSSLPGEGKTFCAINLAISIALERDHTVLLVDADVAKPSVPQVLGFEAEKGLMDVLLDRRIDLADMLWKTSIDKLTLLTAGSAHHHATELLASDEMRVLLREMAARYHDRIIIFDSSPLLVASEAGVLASQMGQTVLVVAAGETTEATLKDSLGRLELRNIAGLLLNKAEDSALGGYYGGYGYRTN